MPALPCLFIRFYRLVHALPSQAAIDDPSPAVKRPGLVALHRLATRAARTDLSWQRDLLLDLAKRVLTGCDSAVWPEACAAAVALTATLEGREPRSEGYSMLMDNLLTETERQAHEPARAAPFLAAMQALAPTLGLLLVRHFARLMPLLLEWLHMEHGTTCLQACRCLAAVTRVTWPRMPAHAAVLRRHLAHRAASLRHGGGSILDNDERQAAIKAIKEVENVLDEACAECEVAAVAAAAANVSNAAVDQAAAELRV